MIAERQLERGKQKTVRVFSAQATQSKGLRVLLFLLWCFTIIGLIYPQIVTQAAADALIFCGTKLIPSLFPLAAAGSVLARAGIGGRLSEWVGRIMRPMGYSAASTVCLLMGLFAGFPTGAMIASSLVESGQIDSEEASRLCCFTGNASAAFLVGTVGSGMFGDARIGWLLWLAQTLASLTVGVLMGRRASKRCVQTPEHLHTQPMPFDFGTVSRAIASSAQGMLSLAAFVAFFAAVTAVVSEGMHALTASLGIGKASALIETAIGGLLEISGGLRSASALNLPLLAKVLVASAITGWSGLSVYMQVLAAAKGLTDSHTAALPKRLAKAKAVSALLTALYAALFYWVFLR